MKIIDKSQDIDIQDSIAAEINVLSFLPKHKYISKCTQPLRRPVHPSGTLTDNQSQTRAHTQRP